MSNDLDLALTSLGDDNVVAKVADAALDLDALIAKHGPMAELDQAFRRALHCPVCGATGGGLEIRPPMDFIR